ncbi:hypothetical protein HpCOL14_13410 [Helicobacter pylori]
MWRSLDPTNTPKLPLANHSTNNNSKITSQPYTIGTTTNYGKLNYIKIGLNQNFNANVGTNQDSPFLTSFLKSFL